MAQLYTLVTGDWSLKGFWKSTPRELTYLAQMREELRKAATEKQLLQDFPEGEE